jgi:glycosyltransferase involved in cell wall biosynthesis
MSVGTPVVATLAGGTDEIVIDGVTGFTVPVRDSVKIAEKVKILLETRACENSSGLRG